MIDLRRPPLQLDLASGISTRVTVSRERERDFVLLCSTVPIGTKGYWGRGVEDEEEGAC